MQEGTHDTMQVCMGGHQINSSYLDFPQFNAAFCAECGEPTITACQACKAPIKGYYRGSMAISGDPVPSFCDACGKPYPWQISKVANALELLTLEGVAEADVQEIERNLPDITRDTPRSQVAARRIRNALGKVSKPVYDVAIKVVGDIAAATAKSYLDIR